MLRIFLLLLHITLPLPFSLDYYNSDLPHGLKCLAWPGPCLTSHYLSSPCPVPPASATLLFRSKHRAAACCLPGFEVRTPPLVLCGQFLNKVVNSQSALLTTTSKVAAILGLITLVFLSVFIT